MALSIGRLNAMQYRLMLDASLRGLYAHSDDAGNDQRQQGDPKAGIESRQQQFRHLRARANQ
jgi:hypothetical protein